MVRFEKCEQESYSKFCQPSNGGGGFEIRLTVTAKSG